MGLRRQLLWVLRDKGRSFVQTNVNEYGPTRRINSDEPDLAIIGDQPVEVYFESQSDGRGFSLARRLRQLRGPKLRLIAAGDLIPDQARMAFQCGFDEIWVEDAMVRRHGQRAWREAVSTASTALYIGNSSDRLATSPGWDQRHQDQVMVKSLTAAETFEELQKINGGKILDVRTSAELNFVGYVSHANCHFIEWKSFPDGLINADFVAEVEAEGLTKNCLIFVICRSGVRSLEAAQRLRDHGFKNLTNVSDGFEGDLNAQGRRGRVNGWKASGLPWQQQ